MNASHPGLAIPAVLLCCLAVACGGSEQPSEGTSTGQTEVTPLTREEIRERAEAMSPQVAESLGIVDTTIHIQSPAPAESIDLPTLPADSAVAR